MKSIYIHIPFCKKICCYCDFSKIYYKSSIVSNYLMELKKEINKYYNNEEISTLYIGGGTPSCLNIEELETLFSIINIFDMAKTKEFTIECNVEDITEEKLKLFKKNKVTRLSIGVQTFNKKYLAYLGRNKEINIIEKISLVKKYFDNINMDIIYALKNQTLEDIDSDLNNVINLNIPHVSLYSLIIEPHTKLYIEKVTSISEEIDRKMYDYIKKKLKEKNYSHYEVSNFSKKGYQSKHNLRYWNNEQYYGFGLGSHGYIANIRYENTRSINKYLLGDYRLEEHNLIKQEIIENELILGFRKLEGINKQKFKNKYGINIEDLDSIRKHLKLNNLICNKEKIYINPNYIYTMNDIIVDFIGGNNER